MKFTVKYDGSFSTVEIAKDDDPDGTSFVAAKLECLNYLRGLRDDLNVQIKIVNNLKLTEFRHERKHQNPA